jgi:crotonobetainyl-CoA:carnitine CoA-transferase CaiB-like acyl-CoA transferase
VKLEGTPGSVRRAPPLLSEHTREVLTELGFSQEEISTLVSSTTSPRGQRGHS